MKIEKMNPEVKAKWVAALRSGDYAQAQGVLKGENEDGTVGHCCLGVLCELAVEEGILAPPVLVRNTTTFKFFTPDAHESEYVTSFLSGEVAEWAGIQTTGDYTWYEDEYGEEVRGFHLADMNDTGSTFAEIADVIEDNL